MDTRMLLYLILLLAVLNLVLGLILAFTKRQKKDTTTQDALERLERQNERTSAALRQEMVSQMREMSELNASTLLRMGQGMRGEMESTREAVERRLAAVQQENRMAFEQIRGTVDQRLTTTLAKGLHTSFESVNGSLEQMLRAVGEMKTMTGDVTDLKKILSNVRDRGEWGEIQLETLLSDMLAPSQFARQFMLPGGKERVDFAVKMPGNGEEAVYLPLDSKFPLDKYQALLAAEEEGDKGTIRLAKQQLLRAVEEQALSVSRKYIRPPVTTDFALLFVPSEGLYGTLYTTQLPSILQKEHKVVLAGPSTLMGLLNSLQMGFRSFAIQQQTIEVARLLASVRKGFGAFTEHLEGVRKSLAAAENHLEKASSGSRTIERRLRGVEELEGAEEFTD